MASLDAAQLLTSMATAAQASIGQQWPAVRDYAEDAFASLAHTLVQIEGLKLTGKISEAEASVLFETQKNATSAVLLALQGMSLILVESALNAALGAVRSLVNGAIGFALL